MASGTHTPFRPVWQKPNASLATYVVGIVFHGQEVNCIFDRWIPLQLAAMNPNPAPPQHTHIHTHCHLMADGKHHYYYGVVFIYL